MSDNLRCVVECRNRLGESPVWDVREQALYWVDIHGRLLQRLVPKTGEVSRWSMPDRLSSFALREKGGLVVAFASGLAFFDTGNGKLEWIASPEEGLAGNRFNEGKVDRLGRYWAGTMNEREPVHSASLYRLDPDRTVHKMLGGIGISNCFVWSRENDRFWLADSMDGQVSVFDYDHEQGSISNRRIFADMSGTGYVPDGGTIDAEGYLWIAMWDGGKVMRFAADGRVDREIPLPVSRPTSCMFGGPDLKTLYITSASLDLEGAALAAQPLAGCLFALETDVPGLAEHRFKG